MGELLSSKENAMKFKLNKYSIALIVILAAGLFLRVYKARMYLPYGHDNDLEGWVIKDILVNGHFRLIGQETSTQGIFIGSLYYYLLIPFYLLTGLDPVGAILLSVVLGMFGIWSFYFVFKTVFKKQEIGLTAALISAVSYASVMNDRGSVPTMPVVIWTVWYFYAIAGIFSRKYTKSFILLGILVSLIWHLNVALVLLTLLIPISLLINHWRFKLKKESLGIVTFFLTSIPFFVFELRHNFIQVRAVVLSFTTSQGSQLSLLEQFKRVLHMSSQIITNIFWYPSQKLNFVLPLLLFIALFFLVVKKKLSKALAAVLFVWSALPVVFFSFYSKQVSEYYLNGMVIVWTVLLTLSLYYLLTSKKYKLIGFLFLAFFIFANLFKFFTYKDSRQGYIYRKALVADIKKDAQKHDYACIAISYITSPGYDLGYRYLFWLENMHVNRPSLDRPVYTIVFPLNDTLFSVHKTFGSLGLIYPDYKRYTKDKVTEGCSGQNSNLTDPMFGYTE